MVIIKNQLSNPYLPSFEYIADGEPHVFGNRLYIFGSHDSFGGKNFCEKDYVCWSAPVDDLSDWKYEGVIYRKNQDLKNKSGKMRMFAPDVCKGNDGRYYLFYGLSFLPSISVAVCDEPAGKYEFYGYVKHPNGKLYGTEKGDFFPFDPGVINDNGKIYLYSGFSPDVWFLRLGIDLISPVKGAKGNQVLELENDMLTVKTVKQLIPGTHNSKGTGFEGHEFYEASSIRKFGDKYYFIYSSVLSHELAYAVSDYPDRDFKFAGTLHSNGDIGINGNKNPMNYWGNNHGSVEYINGEYYVFGHRHTYWRECSRQGVAEKLGYENGLFTSAEMTSCGLNGKPLGLGRYEAGIVCNLFAKEGAEKSVFFKNKKKTQIHPCIMQTGTDRENEPCQYIHNMRDGCIAGFKYFECDCKEITLTVRGGKGRIDLYFDLNGDIITSLNINESTDFAECSAPLQFSGKKAIYLKYSGEDYADLLSVELK
ncbi:MAG: family 43 glycosylhydrolase [Clostridia bacterium]|nr:family 43 glycosylhydrolase [Clostridia bacterium]